MHTYIHTYIHTYTYIHIHTYTYMYELYNVNYLKALDILYLDPEFYGGL